MCEHVWTPVCVHEPVWLGYLTAFSSNILLRKIIEYLENMKKYNKATNLLFRFYYKHFLPFHPL